jgi:hypothetical protein
MQIVTEMKATGQTVCTGYRQCVLDTDNDSKNSVVVS